MPRSERRPSPRPSPLAVLLTLALLTPLGHAQSGNAKAARFYEDALTRYERKDIAGAIIQLKNALQIDKTMLPVQVLLGRALLANGEAAAAEIAITESLRLGVNRAEVAITLAQALLAQGKQNQMLEQARLSPAGLPPGTRYQLLLLRASAYSDLGDPANALRTLEEARGLDASAADSWVAEVPLRLRSHQFREAVMAADKALALNPRSPEALYQKGSIAHQQANPKAALSAYDQALQIEPGHVEARVARAGLYVDLGRDADAAADVVELQKRSPGEPRAAYLKALLAERAGDAAAARAALREVVGLLDPVPPDFIRYRPQLQLLNGLSHFGLGEWIKAKPYLESFYRNQPGSPVSKLLGRIYVQEKNPDRAVDVLEAYLRSYPGDGQALTLLAGAHLAKGRHSKATALMQQALRSKDAPEFHTVLGLSLMQAGEAGTARGELEAALQKDPGQMQAALSLIGLYLRQGPVTKAISTAEALLKRQPDNPVFLNLLGIGKAQSGDATGARKAFERALQIDAGLLPPQLGLARLDIAAKAYDAAAARLNAILKQDERNTEALYDLAVLAERRGQPEESLRLLTKATDFSGPRDTRAGFALVDLHLRQGRAAPALEAAKALLAKQPDDVAALFIYARAQAAVGDSASARQSLVNASRRAGFDATALTDIAALQLRLDDLPGAGYSLEKALSSQPDFPPAATMMAAIELRRGELPKAEARARRLIQTQPALAVGHQLLGDVALARKQPGAALEAYRQAFKVQPGSASLLPLLATMSAQGNAKGAQQMAEQWLKANPRDIAVRKSLANGLARAGDFGGARKAFEELLKLAPNDAEALNNLANVLLKLKDPAAVAVAEQALARNPSDANLIDTLGWTLFHNGQTELALQLLRDARLRDPGNPEIRYHLAATLAKAGRKAEARDELATTLRDKLAFNGAAEAQALMQTLK